MASEMNTKIRFVRCPKCLLVLPELSEIPVYKCGGCNTVLEAKHRKTDTKETRFDYNKTDENVSKEADHVSGYSHSKKDTEISDNSDNINMKHPQDAVFSNETHVSSGQNCSTVKKNQTKLDKKNNISCKDTGQLESHVRGDENTAWDRGIRVSDDSTELTSFEIEVTSLDEDRYDTDRCTEADEIVSDNAKRRYSKDSSFFSDVPFVMTDSSPEIGLHNKPRGKSVHLSRQHHAGSKVAFNEPEVKSVRGTEKREVDELFKAWTFKGPRAQESDSLSNLPTTKPRFEQGVPRAEFSKSPTRSCYRCSGSFSCNDGLCDQGPSRTSKPPRRMCCNESGELNSLSSKIGMHCNGYNRPGVYDPASPFQEANHNNMKYTKHSHENLRETRHCGLCRTRPQNEDYVPRNNFPASCCQVHIYGLCSPDTPLYSGPDKLELLKMINELKDELKRTQISNIGFPTRISGEQTHTAATYHQATAPVECTDRLHSSKCNQVNYVSHEPRVSNIGFPTRISGEQRHTAATYHQAAAPVECTDCLPSSKCNQVNYVSHEPRVSRMACLGRHGTTVNCCNEAQCLNHNSHTFYKGSSSSSPSHQPYARHQFVHRERDSSPKRYIRPTAGGTPFISCYHCSEVLQVPADFLVLGRRYHKLRCNACRRTMKFFVQGKGHLVPCFTDAVAPPPSMVDDYSDSRSDLRDMRHKNLVDTIELTGTRNGKELSPESKAAIHRLLGYSPLSQVIRPHRKAVE